MIKLLNGEILDIEYDNENWGGCETCDYGSRYINDITLKLTSHTITIRTEQMYEYAISEGYMMRLLCGNIDAIRQMSQIGFYEWLKEELTLEFGGLLEQCELH